MLCYEEISAAHGSATAPLDLAEVWIDLVALLYLAHRRSPSISGKGRLSGIVAYELGAAPALLDQAIACPFKCAVTCLTLSLTHAFTYHGLITDVHAAQKSSFETETTSGRFKNISSCLRYACVIRGMHLPGWPTPSRPLS